MSARNTPKIDFEFALRKLVKCLYVYIGKTEHSGFGIFAARHFKAGVIIIADEDGDYYDNAMSYEEVIKNGHDIGHDCIQIGSDLYNLPNGNLDDIMNYCCDPTTGLRLTGKGYQIIALRDIAPSDELTYDYSTYISGKREILHCQCGAANCRQIIGSFRDLPEDVKQRYLEWDVVGDFALERSTEPTTVSA